MSKNGALLTEDEARWLSRRLYPLGDQWADLCRELDQAGYGLPAAVFREAYAELAATDAGRTSLRTYWQEYAKERLAGLSGPMNTDTGQLPAISAYRSGFMDRLRADAVTRRLQSGGAISLRPIEPTIKRFVEMLPDDPSYVSLNGRVLSARQRAAERLGLVGQADFAFLSPDRKDELLIERYRSVLEPAGFTLDSHRRTGLVFRKITSDGRWAFLFVDDSPDGIGFGTLSTHFELTLPRKAVLPTALPLSAVATFSSADIVPGFVAGNGFSRNSYAQFCLAADTNTFLAKTVLSRLDALLTA